MSKTKHILVIEDDVALAGILKSKLTGEGYRVSLAKDGQVALKFLEENKPDLILLDIVMPEMNGWDFLDKVKANEHTAMLPVIFLTNLGEERDIKLAYAKGALDYVIKSNTSIKDILLVLSKYL